MISIRRVDERLTENPIEKGHKVLVVIIYGILIHLCGSELIKSVKTYAPKIPYLHPSHLLEQVLTSILDSWEEEILYEDNGQI